MASPIQYRFLWLATFFIVIALLLLPVGYEIAPQVEHSFLSRGQQQRVSQVYIDTISTWGVMNDPITGKNSVGEGFFRGYLYRPASGVLWLENGLAAPVTLRLDDEIVYEGNESTRLDVSDSPDIIAFELRYQSNPETINPRHHMGFMLEDVFGRQYLMPDWNYAPDADTAFDTGADIARFLFIVCLPLIILLTLASLRLSRREWLLLIGIFGLALLVQSITMQDKLVHNELMWTMETTWDNYVARGREWLVNYYPIGGQEAQQGNFIYLGVLQRIMGSNHGTLYWFNTLAGAIVPVLLCLAGWGFFNKRVGIVAGIIAALFAPLLHYQQTLQPAAAIIFLIAFFMAGGYLLYRDKHPLMAIACGVIIGIMTVMRGSTILLFAWIPLLLLIQHSTWRRKILLFGLATAGLIVVLMPIIITNWHAGVYILTPSRSDIQLLRANNLTTMGLNSHMNVSEVIARARGDQDYMGMLREDIARDPARLLELTARRVGLLWDSSEHSDSAMIDYLENSYNPTQSYKLLSAGNNITMRTLFLLATISLLAALLAGYYRRDVLLIAALAALYCLTMIPFYVLGRLRIGIAPVLILLVAVGLVFLWEQRKQQQVWRKTVIASVIIIGLIAVSADFLVSYFPRPQYITVDAMPDNHIPVNADFGDEVRLQGYGYVESDTTPDGYLVFELYWQALQDIDEDYVLILRLLDPATQDILGGENFTIGTETAPDLKTSGWRAGQMIFERYLIRLSSDTDTIPAAYEVYAGVYSNITEDQLLLTTAERDVWADDNVRLMALSLQADIATIADSLPSEAIWENAVALTMHTCTVTDNSVALSLDLQMQGQIHENPHLFVHAYRDDEFIEGLDAKVIAEYPVDGWLPGEVKTIDREIRDIAGINRVDIGFYNPRTAQRWTITGAVDGYPVANNILSLPCS